MEVIIVDDGSVDTTPVLCDNYALKDKRIRVFHKSNGGVSSARNVGIDNAHGHWITFVDSDDVLAENALNHIFAAIATQNTTSPDIIVENMLFLGTNNQRDLLYGYKLHSLNMMYERGHWGSVFNKVYLKNIITDNGIRFDESLHFGEDWLFVAQYCYYVRRFTYIDKVCYFQYVPDNYGAKYSQYNGLDKMLIVYSKIKKVNQQCSISLVDGLTMSLLRDIGLSSPPHPHHHTHTSELIINFQSIVGSDVKYAKGRKKALIRALSHIGSSAIWVIVFKLYSYLRLY